MMGKKERRKRERDTWRSFLGQTSKRCGPLVTFKGSMPPLLLMQTLKELAKSWDYFNFECYSG